ncbi:MAG: hypothetical protein VXY93_18515, partial [Pseudomonadota bacterium]|nr:hypothetical protein [Pseudomonadota bacterium]
SINIGLGASIAQHNDNTLTFGTNGDPRITIDASGNLNVGSAATIAANGNVTAGIVTATEFVVGAAVTIGRTNGNATFAGIVTATAFKGDGSGLSGVTAVTINNNANNRVITGSGSANTLEAESNMTFTGSILTVTNSSGASELTLVTPSANDSGVYFNDGSNAGAVTYNHSDDSMRFRVGSQERLRITGVGGSVGINEDAPLYELV